MAEDKKGIVVKLMEEELERANNCNIEPISGESYMTVQYVYHMMKTTFEQTFVPDHILEIFSAQMYPLSKFYDYFYDQGYFTKKVNWEELCREYLIYSECEFLEERLHDKVYEEYKAFMSKLADLTPYKLGKLISEISIKMQVFSIFRYQDCFGIEDMKLLQEVDGLLDVVFRKHDGASMLGADEHVLWAKTMEYLKEVVDDARGPIIAEEDNMER